MQPPPPSSSSPLSKASSTSNPHNPSSNSQAQPSSSPSKSNNLFSIGASAIQSFALESIISASSAPPRLPASKSKDPLSLPTTTKNFRGFVQKSGPIFWFQDGVIATLTWEDTTWTLLWMSIWAIISIYPLLLLCAPSAILSIILVKTHQARFPPRPSSDSKGSGAGPGGGGKSGSNGGVESSPAQALNDSTQRPTKNKYIGSARPPLTPNPPNEGSIHYYENLRDIQNMMKMVTDAYDLIVPIVSYLNWSSYPRSLLVFQLSILATVAMFFLGPFIPLRLIMFLSVEGIFVMNHPWTLPALQGMSRRARKSKEGRMITNWLKEMGHVVREWVERDRLDDEVWEKGWRDVEMFENQRFQATSTAGSKEVSGTWSAHNLTFGERKSWTKGSDGWSEENLQVTGYSVDISRKVAMTLEPGWKWVEGDDWRIDWLGRWSSVGVDDEGFVYTDSSWQRPCPSPFSRKHLVDQEGGRREAEAQPDHEDQLGSSSDLDEEPGSKENHLFAETRRRRWLRRAVRI